MSKETVRAVEEALRAHVADLYSEEDGVMIDWVVGYAAMHHDSDVHDGTCFRTGYLTAQASTPHAAVGLFSMSADRLMEDLRGDGRDDE